MTKHENPALIQEVNNGITGITTFGFLKNHKNGYSAYSVIHPAPLLANRGVPFVIPGYSVIQNGWNNMAGMCVVFGPPGTGKTQTLTRMVEQYAATEGSDTLLLCAFTNTAAKELAGRNGEIQNSGTLHALCFRALDRPPIAETHYHEWNDLHRQYSISAPNMLVDREYGGPMQARGDWCLNIINIARHQCIPPSCWPSAVQLFWQLWSAWKHETGYIDFTDMIELAYTLLPVAPGHPSTIIVDEAQDMSLLQWSVLLQWAQHAERLICGGDDEQCLYKWCGADFRPMLAAPSRKVLQQSYRVPVAHHHEAMRASMRIHAKVAKVWHPRAEKGLLRKIGLGWQHTDFWSAHADRWLQSTHDGSYTFLAPCHYMLTPITMALREAGIPFGNRWRLSNRAWNPLEPPRKGIGMVQRLLDFLRPMTRLWTWAELATWLPLIRTEGVLYPHSKALVALRADETHTCSMEELSEIFLNAALPGALTGGLSWLQQHALQVKRKGLAYPCHIYRRFGRQALTDEPRIHIGTANSFKGAESDVVVNFTDLSHAQKVALCQGRESADDIWRMRYVAATRSRHAMIMAGPSY